MGEKWGQLTYLPDFSNWQNHETYFLILANCSWALARAFFI
jgi:hypothetical protein